MRLKLVVFTPRWGHDNEIELTHNKQGWKVSQIHGGQSDKTGAPHLFKNLRNDRISYPDSLAEIMEDLWTKIEDEGISQAGAQHYLNMLSVWINATTSARVEWPSDCAALR